MSLNLMKAESYQLPPVLKASLRGNPSAPFEWVLEKELNAEFVAQYPNGSEFRIVGGQTIADNERLVEKLKVVCPTFVYGGVMNMPFGDEGKIMLTVEYQITRVVLRCLCKTAFNIWR